MGDTISNIEGINGTPHGDVLTGDAGPNLLIGMGGNDTISGGGGADVFIGSGDIDTITGGSGSDAFIGSVHHLAGDTITDFEVGDSITVRFKHMEFNTNLINHLKSLEGSAATDSLDLNGNSQMLTLNRSQQWHLGRF